MKLTAYSVNGKTVGIDLLTYSDLELNGLPPFKVESVVSSGYVDISSVKNWHILGLNTGKDYRYVRDRIKDLLIEKGSGDQYAGFELLTQEEKIIAIEHKLGSHNQRVTTVGIDNTVKLGLLYHSRATTCREVRSAYATAELHNRLPNEAESILNEIMSLGGNLFITYVFFGREGTIEGDNYSGIMDYLFGRVGTEFENNGLLQKPYTPEGMSMLQLVNKLHDIMINGNY